MIHRLGTDRFGILMLAWTLVGYFGLFDFGMGRALTRLVATLLANNRQTAIPSLVWTALALMGMLGILGGCILVALTQILIDNVLKVPSLLRGEVQTSFYILAIAIPIVITSTALRGVLEAYQRFDLVASVQVPLGAWTFLGPLLGLVIHNSLVSVVALLLFGRLVVWVVYLGQCIQVQSNLMHVVEIQRDWIRDLFIFGGWLTLTAVIGPVLLYADRFFVAGILGVSMVAYYATLHEMVTRLLIIPSAVVSVMFPEFSKAFSSGSSSVAVPLYKKAIKYVLGIMSPIVLILFVFANKILSTWLNEDFAHQGTWVIRFLLLGVLINALGLISQAFIQASGFPDWTAKLQLIEVPFFLFYLWILLNQFGINGAALAWLSRVTISAVALAFLSFLRARSISSPTLLPRMENL